MIANLTPKPVTNTIDLQNFISKIEYRVARTIDELEQSYKLVYKEYLKRNYTEENKNLLRLSEFNALPQTTTFVASAYETVIATATVIIDSPLGLPMDKIYNKELTKLRNNKKKICEISMLSSNNELFQDGVSLLLNSKKMFFVFLLFKNMFDYIRNILKFDDICITINPKHDTTYDFLLFKNLGELKSYDEANGAPAIAKHLDLKSSKDECLKQKRSGVYKMFFAKNTNPEKFNQKINLTPKDLNYFFVKKSNIFKTISSDKLEYIKSCYPNYDFSKIVP